MKFLKISMMILILVLCSLTALAQTTAFSYQGRLSELGNPVTGTRFFRFTLFDENGAAIPGAVIDQALTVTNGVFNTSLDFGAANFPGANRSLLISVKINAGDAYTDLSPRQDILAAPYSIKSKTSDDAAKLGGVDSTRFVQQDAGGNVSVGGNLTVAGAVTYDTVNATTQYNLGGQRILGTTAGSGNLYAGLGAGQSNTTGIYNTFVGTIAGRDNTTGTSNSFFGYNTGLKNTIGLSNSFFGDGAGKDNVVGNANSFFGNQAGFQNTANFNSFFGYVAGQFNTTGVSNSFFGANAGQNNTTGSNNSFFGYQSGLGNVNGVFNAFFGRTAGLANTLGSSNTFVGAAAGENNTTGNSNTFVGAAAGGGPCPVAPCAVTLTGSKNSFFGESSGINNTSGANNVFLGATSGEANTTGADNTFVGTNSGAVNVAGSQNAFFGRDAGRNNLAGFNSFFGFSAGSANTNGGNNAFFGNSAGLSNITGNNNAYFGTGAGDTATGSGNTAIGDNAGVTFFVGTTNTNGNNNTFLGYLAKPSIGNLTNATAIGANSLVSQSNSLILGNNANVGIGTSSPNSKLEVRTPNSSFGIVHTDGTVRVGTGVVEGGTFGTISNHPLFFFTNDIRRMSITTSGNVGIGTNTPNSKLTVVGLIETTTGGVKFPDGTIQTTAGGGGGFTLPYSQTLSNASNLFSLTNTGTGGAGAFAINNPMNGNPALTAGTNGNGAAISATGYINTTTYFGINDRKILSVEGAGNLFVGQFAGVSNTPNTPIPGYGLLNTFVGDNSGSNNTTGESNSFFGTESGAGNVVGDGNSFFGVKAGLNNMTTGNSFFGNQSGKDNTNGGTNSFFGFFSGWKNTSGAGNAFFGAYAGRFNTTGTNNTVVGNAAGNNTTTGSNNTFLGAGADIDIDVNPPNLNFATAIGAKAVVSQSNSLVLGSVNGVNGGVDIKVGIGTTRPKAKLDVTGGNILVGSPGQGIILKSPDGATCKLLSIDNSGAMVLAAIACP